MSLSRSPSPQDGGGWSTPGLTAPYDKASTDRKHSPTRRTNGTANNVSWASAQAKSAGVRGYEAFAPRSNGVMSHVRRVSTNLAGSLPFWKTSAWEDKDKLGRGRWGPNGGNKAMGSVKMLGRIAWKLRSRLLLVLMVAFVWIGFWVTPLHLWYRRAGWAGGGEKFVIILPANVGGGVMEWKGPREWAIERDSVKNKKAYAKKWGYNLEVVDMTTKKRYAHEWRESWEKVDTIRNTMRKYPEAQWFWWLDLHTLVMEHSLSLQSHVFKNLAENTYRDIRHYNPLNIPHPFNDTWLDENARSPVGDGLASSINLIVPQDCAGFNLGSFFIRRSQWTDRLLDIWWDPVGYEQKHMEWEHKEQDALEYLYRNQPWIRPHVAFIPQRRVNAFPPGACKDVGDGSKIHYREDEKDFVVNMAGCEWGRDCWGEMHQYRELSNRINRSRWEKFKDSLSSQAQKLKQPAAKKEEKKQ